MGNVVEVSGLSRRFGNTQALDGVTLEVPNGCVFGLVGENGAGKTTLLKHLLGLYQPQQGDVRVFGVAPSAEPVRVLSQIGYLSEDRLMPEWMTIGELTRYTSTFYPDWDDRYAQELQRAFELTSGQRISELSRGQRARVGLVLALAYRPPLLLLDEPSSGLDPVVRRDILGAIIRAVAEEGRTVVFSSHLLDEVQRVSDCFAMLHHGQVTLSGSLDELLTAHQRITIRFVSPPAEPPELEGVLQWEGEGRDWTAICNGERELVERQLRSMGADVVDRSQPTLEEIFVARTRGPA